MEIDLGHIRDNTNSDMPLMRGEKVKFHAHWYDHSTFVNRGRFSIARIAPDGTCDVTEVAAHDERPWVTIQADCQHELTALEDNSIYHCIWVHRNSDGSVSDRYTGWDKAYREKRT